MNTPTITTERLVLIPATEETLEAELQSTHELGRILELEVPTAWPPPLYDRPGIEWTLDRLRVDPLHLRWGFHYFVLREDQGGGGPRAIAPEVTRVHHRRVAWRSAIRCYPNVSEEGLPPRPLVAWSNTP